MRKIFQLLFISLTKISIAIAQEEANLNELIKILNNEQKTIEKVKNKSDKLFYRLFELQNEKTNIYKKIENKAYLENKNNNDLFKKTRINYQLSKKLGETFIKRYPHSKYLSEIYYSMALNSRDYSNDNLQEKYLKLSLSKSDKNGQTHFLAKTSLAEYYYNEKKFERAKSLFGDVVKKTNDEWLTKNLYNYAWTLFKTKNHQQAISILEASYLNSKKGFYIDFKQESLNSLILFYASTNNYQRGSDFIKKNETNYHPHILNLIIKSNDKGFSKDTEENLAMLKLESAQINNKQYLADLSFFEIQYLHKAKKFDTLIKSLKENKNQEFKHEQKEEIINILANNLGIFQLRIKNQNLESTNLIENIESFTNLLIEFNPKEKGKYYYYLAETYFNLNNYELSNKNYTLAFNQSTDIEIQKKSLIAIMAISEKDNAFKKLTNYESNLNFAFTNYLGLFPNDKISKDLFSKYIHLQLKKDSNELALELIIKFNKYFPSEVFNQKEFFKQIMDKYISSNSPQKFNKLLSLMKNKFLNFEKQEIEKAESILTNLLFDHYKKLAQSNNQIAAIDGYKSILHNEIYPKNIRAQAAFEIGITQIDNQNTSDSLKWFQKSFDLFEKNELASKKIFLEKLQTKMYLLQDFKNSANLGRFILKKFCKDKSNLRTFEQTIRSDLANDYILKVNHTYNSFSKCVTSSMKEIENEIFIHLYTFDHESDFLSFIVKKNIILAHSEKITPLVKKIFWKRYLNQQGHIFLTDIIANLNCDNCKTFKKHITEVYNFSDQIKKFEKEKIVISERFEPLAFNSALEKRIQQFKVLNMFASNLFDKKDIMINLITLNKLSSLNLFFANEIKNFSPTGTNEFIISFKKQMNQLSNSFISQKDLLDKKFKQTIFENEIFVNEFSSNFINSPIDTRRPILNLGATFDLTGSSL